ncbi:predicted protein [Thalassiosira pseudonana CCMP1335]|uniref:Chitin-binding type-2 domain-containing protein n=1 Tax=Thalassiosira pseudonana TaxID=35128 RepID=B8CAH7_THAPS|nr:predicted protein [Thalassiosira pseudonana CCMP1335]EED89681.1 predicted protein [Thalassiosira pseudonana CCMP1335]
MRNNFIPPPPPRTNQARGPYAQYTNSAPPNRYGNLEDIDDDDDDDHTEISDNDSILAMAKRLDDASVISDPSIIEGPVPHLGGLDPSGYGMDRHPSEMGGGKRNSNNGNLYGRERDLDSIASNDHEDDEDYSVYTDGSGSQYTDERGGLPPQRQFQQQQQQYPQPGVPRVGHYDGPPSRGGTSFHSAGGSRGNAGGSRGTSVPKYSYQGGYNSKPIGRGRSMSPSVARDRRGAPPPASRVSQQRGGGGGGGVYGRDGRYDDGSRGGGKRRNDESVRSDQKNGRSKWRKVKLAAIPISVVLVIAVSIVVVFVTKGGGDDSVNESGEMIDIAISPPTTSPTYAGDYFCPVGIRGPVPTKGCLGYVQCDGYGDIEGTVLPCGSGTLFDVKLNTCTWADDVDCATKPPNNVEDGNATTPTTPTSKPSSPPAPSVAETSELKGPITTSNHQLSFVGIKSPGDMTVFEQNLENYVNIFFSPTARVEYALFDEETLALFEKDDILQSLTDVNVVLSVQSFNLSSRLRKQRYLQNGVPELVMTYDQDTEYRTSDSSISIGAIVRHPYEEKYQPALVEYLKSTDDVFASLQSVNFLEGGESSKTAPPTKKPTNAPSKAEVVTDSPTPFSDTPGPTDKVTTKAPSNKPASSAPTESPIVFFPAFTEYMWIRGFVWEDVNKDGIYQTNTEPAAPTSLFMLHKCTDKNGDWIQGPFDSMPTKTNPENGQYEFQVDESGMYMIQFYPPSGYGFTTPNMGGGDTNALDSDISNLSGQTDCFEVKSGYKDLINVGYKTVDAKQTTSASTQSAASDSSMTSFCAEVTTTNGNQSFNFFGCATKCESGSDSECPNGQKCRLNRACSDEGLV